MLSKCQPLVTVIITLICLNSTLIWAGNTDKESKQTCLVVEGKINNGLFKNKNTYKVELISAGVVIDSVKIESKNKFNFRLNRNRHYAIRITGAGCITKIVSIRTDVPDSYKEVQCFSFETGMITNEEAKALNRDALDFPVAMVAYNKEKKVFYHCDKYNKFIKEEVGLPEPKPVTKLVPTPGIFGGGKTNKDLANR